jgi:ribosomal protein S27AE
MIYPKQWIEYRRRHLVASIGLVAGLPTVVAVAVTARSLGVENPTFVFVILAVIWVGLWGWSAFRVIRFPCPRCGLPFLANQEPQYQATRSCSKCGLGLYEQP